METAVGYETIGDFAARVGVHRHTVENWMKKGLPHIRIEKVVRIVSQRADEWMGNFNKSPGDAVAPPVKRSKRTVRPA